MQKERKKKNTYENMKKNKNKNKRSKKWLCMKWKIKEDEF
jgi:hypothetical protein